MSALQTKHRYDTIAQSLHWIIAALVVTQFILANLAEDAPSKMQTLALLARHKSVGMTILMLAVVRLLWRLRNPPPALPAGMKAYERKLARLTHVLFYALLFCLPLTGWTMSSARGFTVSWFGLFSWPDLIARNQDNFKLLESVHGALAVTLFSLAVLHILAALKHHFWNKDEVLKRMLPFTRTRGGR